MPNKKHITADQLRTSLIKVKNEIDNAGGATQTVTTYTLSSSGWSNGVYSGIQSSYPHASYNVVVSPYAGMTDAQLEAFTKAKLVGYSDSNNLKATGTVPSVNIPVMLTLTTK